MVLIDVLVDPLHLLLRDECTVHGHPHAVRNRFAAGEHRQLLQEACLPAQPREEPEPHAYPLVKILARKSSLCWLKRDIHYRDLNRTFNHLFRAL